MRGFIKRGIIFILVTVFLATSMCPWRTMEAEASMVYRDLVVDLNIPQVTREITDNEIGLNALHVNQDGSFTLGDKIKWSSSNKSVATVDENGHVVLTGAGGSAYITATDGKFTDKITIKMDKNMGQASMVKQNGSRYNLITNAIRNMSVEEKVGQMLMPDFRKWKGENVTAINPEIQKLIKDYHIGGVILFKENTVTREQMTRLTDAYQNAADKFALIVSVDQEGGIVTRLQEGTSFPGNMALGAAQSEDLTQKVGKAIGEELNSVGINMNFAPVMDVNINPDNPVIGVRSFGSDPELVSSLGKAFMRGLKEAGIASTAKHFPGHGDTEVDSHLGLPEVPYTMDRLKEIELYPFKKAMESGIDAVMTAHVTFPEIDSTKVISVKDGREISLPATLSYRVLTELMREEMGFKGVIITDAMNMGAIVDNFGPTEAALRAVKAGTDILLMPVGIDEVSKALYQAIHKGEISHSRINQSVERILTLKLNRGIIKRDVKESLETRLANSLEAVGSAEHKSLEREVAEKSITVLKNEGYLPIKADASDTIAVVGNSSLYATSLLKAVKNYHENVIFIDIKDNKEDSAFFQEEQIAQLREAKYIIFGTYTSTAAGRAPTTVQMSLMNSILDIGVPVIALGIRNPYDIMAYPSVPAYLAQYSFNNESFEASVATIFGKINPTGKLPVTIYNPNGSEMYEYGHGLSYKNNNA